MWEKVPNPVRPSQSAKKSLIFYIYPYFLHFNDVTAVLGNCRRFGWDTSWMFSERLYVYIYMYVIYTTSTRLSTSSGFRWSIRAISIVQRRPSGSSRRTSSDSVSSLNFLYPVTESPYVFRDRCCPAEVLGGPRAEVNQARMGAGRVVSCSRGPYVGRQPQMMAVPSSTVLQTMPEERDGTRGLLAVPW